MHPGILRMIRLSLTWYKKEEGALLRLVCGTWCLTLLEPQSRSGGKPVKIQVVLSPNGTAVLKGLTREASFSSVYTFYFL